MAKERELCWSCSRFVHVKIGEKVVKAGCRIDYESPIFELPAPVTQCTEYNRKDTIALHRLENMAWIVEPQKEGAGFKFVRPDPNKPRY